MNKIALVIDDNGDDLDTISTQLEIGLNYSVETAKPSEIERYAGKKFDLVLIDGLNGECFEAYIQLNGGIKFIYSGDEKIIEEAEKRKMKAFFKDRTLLDILAELEAKDDTN